MQKITKETPLAVVGVSQNPEKYGHKIFKDLVAAGYAVTGINPKGGTVSEQELATSLANVTPKPEVVISVVPPQIGLEVLKEAHDLGITHIWLQPGAESEELEKLADELNITLTTNACFMIRERLW